MNPHLVKRAIRALIRDNEAALVSGLTVSGAAKAIAQVTISPHTPVSRGICIYVIAPDMTEHYNASRLGNSALNYRLVTQLTPENVYSLQLHVMDYAVPSSGEGEGQTYERFETDAVAFGTFVARLVNLFRDNATIPPEVGSWTIEVYGDGSEEDRAIRVRDLSSYIEDAQGNVHAELYAIIDFRVKTCGEPDPLT